MSTTANMDILFKREFTSMMAARKAEAGVVNIEKIPIPPIPTISKGKPTNKLGTIRGVEEEYFEKLNNSTIELLPRMELQKRQVLADGSFRKDKEGNYVTDHIPVPQGSLAILSDISIGMKNTKMVGKRKVIYKPSEGYRYVDFVTTPNGRKYIYIVPKSVVFEYNVCALVISQHRKTKFYRGIKVALQSGSYVYMFVVPYTYRSTADQHIIGIKPDYNFEKEIQYIVKKWSEVSISFDITKTTVVDNNGVAINLAISDLDPTLLPENYIKCEGKSLTDTKITDLSVFD